MSQILFHIKSQYIIKSIFSILNYDHALKLVKYNKKLQKTFGINNINYKERSSYQYNERKTIIKEYHHYGYHGSNYLATLFNYIISGCLAGMLFIYVLIFASILASKGAFNENNTKDNYNKNYSKIIDKINLSLFGFLAYIIISYFIIFTWAMDSCNFRHEYGIIIIIKKIILILLGIIYLSYAVLIIIKLVLSYKIKKSKITWFMRCDYVLLVFMFLYLSYIVFNIFIYFEDTRSYKKRCKPKTQIIYVKRLLKFRNIKINAYELPENFIKMEDFEKRKYIINKKNEYNITISEEQAHFINKINALRKENNISELYYDKIIDFKDLIFDIYSEPIIFDYENIFKFSNGDYLLKYSLNDYLKRFNDKDKNIIKILLNNNFNKIYIIIKEDNIAFIFLYQQSNYEPMIKHRNKYDERSEFRVLNHGRKYKYIHEDKFYDC